MKQEVSEPRKKGETDRHKDLKVLAARWARENGLRLVAKEVSFPHNRFRVDVAAFRPHYKVPSKIQLDGDLGVTAVFECKQSRSDLIKDSANQAKALARLNTLVQRKARIESLLKIHLPHLARGDSLFPEFDQYDFESLEHESHSRVLRLIRETQSALSYKTKFDRMFRYKLAHLHYLVLERDIIKPHEVPLGWGLLVRKGDDDLELLEPPTRQNISTAMQVFFLQRLAAAGSRGLR